MKLKTPQCIRMTTQDYLRMIKEAIPESENLWRNLSLSVYFCRTNIDSLTWQGRDSKSHGLPVSKD